MYQAPLASMAFEFLIGALLASIALHGCASLFW